MILFLKIYPHLNLTRLKAAYKIHLKKYDNQANGKITCHNHWYLFGGLSVCNYPQATQLRVWCTQPCHPEDHSCLLPPHPSFLFIPILYEDSFLWKIRYDVLRSSQHFRRPPEVMQCGSNTSSLIPGRTVARTATGHTKIHQFALKRQWPSTRGLTLP